MADDGTEGADETVDELSVEVLAERYETKPLNDYFKMIDTTLNLSENPLRQTLYRHYILEKAITLPQFTIGLVSAIIQKEYSDDEESKKVYQALSVSLRKRFMDRDSLADIIRESYEQFNLDGAKMWENPLLSFLRTEPDESVIEDLKLAGFPITFTHINKLIWLTPLGQLR